VLYYLCGVFSVDKKCYNVLLGECCTTYGDVALFVGSVVEVLLCSWGMM
jgi:hypothetical protein